MTISEEEKVEDTGKHQQQDSTLSVRQEHRKKEHERLKARSEARRQQYHSSPNDAVVPSSSSSTSRPGTATATDPDGDKVAASSKVSRDSLQRQKSRGFSLQNDGTIDFLKDKPGHQTLSRRLAMYLSERYAWYNPQLRNKDREEAEQEGPPEETAAAVGDKAQEKAEEGESSQKKKEGPSLAIAWAFFEHVTLNRYELSSDYESLEGQSCWTKFYKSIFKGERQLTMAEPGESEIPTKLYHPINTPLSQMGDFGHGYGLYFQVLRSFAILSFLAGIINIPNLMFYRSAEYDNTKAAYELPLFIDTSAVCTNRTWVPCPDCKEEDYKEGRGYPVYDILLGYKDINETNGTFLNVQEYFQAYPEEENSTSFVLNYTDESLAKLKQDYGITYTPSDTGDDTMDYEGHGRYTCTGSCLFEILRCQNDDPCDLYLEVHLEELNPFPEYGNAEQFIFTQKTLCHPFKGEHSKRTAAINLATLLFFIFGAWMIRRSQRRISVKFDEDEQTAQDYSINILNPPDDAGDVNEWKDFFEKNFDDCHVTVCTIDRDNDHVLYHFIERREILKKLEVSLPEGTKLDIESLEEEAEKAEANHEGCLSKCFSPAIPKLVARLKELNDKIATELKQKRTYPVTNIFITFETEKAQRDVLSTMTVGTSSAHHNDTTALPDPKYLFRGRHVLELDEPEEPTAIRWDDLNATKTEIVSRLVITSLLTSGLAVVAIFIIVVLYAAGPFIATTVTTLFTTAFPMIAKWMTALEYHRSESSRQKWMFIKIAVFHIVLTTILFSIVIPFLATLDQREASSPGLIPSIHGLFFSQLLLTPALQLSDYMGHLNRHIFGPRAKTQEAMNMNFRGGEVYLADRYANMIKFLFLMVWFSAVYPAAFFMGSFALSIIYVTDRFSLMRAWARTPQVGPQIAEFARNYFIPLAIVMMAIISAYFWSGFPYDNLCEDNETELSDYYYGDWNIQFSTESTSLGGITLYSAPAIDVNFTIEEDDQVYKYCNQNLLNYEGRSFPALPKWQMEGSEWMTEDQESVLVVYGWVGVAILIAVCVQFSLRLIGTIMKGWKSTYKPHGQDMGENFSQLSSIDSFIPEKRSNFFAYPLVLCQIDDDFDVNLFSWIDPDHPDYKYYSLYEDVKDIVSDLSEVKIDTLFSDVQYWPVKQKAN